MRFERSLREVKKRILRGFLDVVIACLLAEKPSWGYEIISEIHNKFHILLSPGNIYPVLHSLERNGYIRSYEKHRRRFYEITDRGREWLNQIVSMCETVTTMMREHFFPKVGRHNEKILLENLNEISIYCLAIEGLKIISSQQTVGEEGKPITHIFIPSPKKVEEIFRNASAKIINENFFNALVFHLKRTLKKDIFEVFLENPSLFYHSLEKVLGKKGAEVYLSGVIRCLLNSRREGGYESVKIDEIIEGLKRNRRDKILKFLVEASSHI